jgi:hypothetical protein
MAHQHRDADMEVVQEKHAHSDMLQYHPALYPRAILHHPKLEQYQLP